MVSDSCNFAFMIIKYKDYGTGIIHVIIIFISRFLLKIFLKNTFLVTLKCFWYNLSLINTLSDTLHCTYNFTCLLM